MREGQTLLGIHPGVLAALALCLASSASGFMVAPSHSMPPPHSPLRCPLSGILWGIRSDRGGSSLASLKCQMFPHISSPTNDEVKRLVKLREQAKFRRQEGTALVVGAAPVSELAGKGCAAEGQIRTLFMTEEGAGEAGGGWHTSYLSSLPLGEDTRIVTVSEAAFKRLSGVESASGKQVSAEIFLPRQASVAGLRRIIIADRIQDPGNLGTLLRTASALGWEGAFLMGGCCDPYNDKCIRAARGAAWRMLLQTGSWDELEDVVEASPSLGNILVADAGGADVGDVAVEDGEGLWLVLSNEGAGVSPDVKKVLEKGGKWKRVGVPMPGDMESLNVAVAGGILMYTLR